MSWPRLPESRRLTDQQAEARVADLEPKFKAAVAPFGVGYNHRARRKPIREPPTPAENLKEIAVAAERECTAADADTQRDAQPAAEILLESGRAAEALRGVDDLRKAVVARIEPRPNLTAGRHVFGH